MAIASGTLPPASHVAYQWHTFFGGDAGVGQNIPATAVDPNGNLYVTGWTLYPWDQFGNPSPTNLNQGVAYLTKISPSGELLWSKFYNGYGASSNGLQATAITLDQAGNIYLAGTGNIVDDGTYGCFVMWTDPNGNFNGGTNIGWGNYGRSCAVYGMTYNPADGYVYLTGMTSGAWRGGQPVDGGMPPNGGQPTNGAQAMFILQAQGGIGGVGLGWVGYYYKADSSGAGTNAYGRAITVDGNSNLIVAGTENGNWDAAVWKVSNTGQQIWETILPFPSGISYAVASDGSNAYVSGYSDNAWNGPAGQLPLNAFSFGGQATCCRAVAFVLKLDTNGSYLWHTFYYGNEQQSIGEGIALDGPTTVYVTGQGDIVGYNNAPPVHDTGGGGHFLLQLDNNGAYQWHSLYGVYRWDEASSIALDSQHHVYVSGWTGFNNWNGDNNTPPLHPSNLEPSDVFVMKFGLASTTTAVGVVAPIVYSPSSQSIALTATVTSAATVNSGTVSFTLLGTTVSASVTGGTASTNFTVPGGTAAGIYTIQAAYNPGTGLAASSDNSHQLTISRATPVITWSNPVDIVFGTALRSTQLNAAANVPGAFVYTPPAGTVLPVGAAQTLSTTFTPGDAIDYNSASDSVLINVTASGAPASPAQIVVTKTLARNGSNQVVVTLNISNAGGTAAQNVQLTVGKINTTPGTTLPQSLGTVAAGGTVTATLTFPGSVGTTGTLAALTVSGTYTGGSFSSASRVTLP
jgi:hypothetical protein